jgi:protein-L-isoaspartate(D-aspartate) O-methyltransferase
MSGYDAARVNMIERQLQPNRVTDERVINAFANIRRELFVPERLRAIAYADDDLPLGAGRYLMAPMVAARLLQAAEIKRGDNALVVGAGPGYEAALLALLCRSVAALEADAELARLGRAALVEHRIATVTFAEGAPAQGGRARSAYDVIFFAGAVAAILPEISGQLAEAGRLVAVVKGDSGPGRATLTTRTGGVLAARVMFDAATPVLPDYARKPAFVF